MGNTRALAATLRTLTQTSDYDSQAEEDMAPHSALRPRTLRCDIAGVEMRTVGVSESQQTPVAPTCRVVNVTQGRRFLPHPAVSR